MCRDRKRRVTLISKTTNPDVINTVKTYCFGTNDELRIVPAKDGKTDKEALKQMLQETDVSGFYVQQPNFYGLFEDASELGLTISVACAVEALSNPHHAGSPAILLPGKPSAAPE